MSMLVYPAWICEACGRERSLYSAKVAKHFACWHEPDPTDENDKCGWCGTNTAPLTEPRDYGFPKRPQ
jgi:hypothetical protein